MILLNNITDRTFKIYENNWFFLMGLLAHDMDNNYTSYLCDKKHRLSSIETYQLINQIRRMIRNHEEPIYELWDGIKTEPIINPDKKTINRFDIKIQPLTDKRRKFLESFISFLEKNKEVKIIHEKKEEVPVL